MDSTHPKRGFPLALALAAALAIAAVFLISKVGQDEFVRFVGPGQFAETFDRNVVSSAWVDDCNDDGFPDLATIQRVDSDTVIGGAFHKLLYSGADGELLQHVPPEDFTVAADLVIVGVDRDTGLLVETGDRAASAELPDLDRYGIDPIDGELVHMLGVNGELTVTRVRSGQVAVRDRLVANEMSFVHWARVDAEAESRWLLVIVHTGESLTRTQVYSWPHGELLLEHTAQDWFIHGVDIDPESQQLRLLGEFMPESDEPGAISAEPRRYAWLAPDSGAAPANVQGKVMMGPAYTHHLRSPWVYSRYLLCTEVDPTNGATVVGLWDTQLAEYVWQHEFPLELEADDLENVLYSWLSDHDGDEFPEIAVRLRSPESDQVRREFGGGELESAYFVLSGATGELLRPKRVPR